MSLKGKKKVVRVMWIIVSIIITFTMILFTIGGALLGSGGYNGY